MARIHAVKPIDDPSASDDLPSYPFPSSAQKPPKILAKEYAAFRPDVVRYFATRVIPKARSVYDPMAATAPLLPYIEYYGIKADFNDIQPLHSYINRAKCYAVYKCLTAHAGTRKLNLHKELALCLSKLQDKTLLISDKWLHDDVMEALLFAWKLADNYTPRLSDFLRAVIVLCARTFGSYSGSYKNRTWHKPGGMSTDKQLASVISDYIDTFSAYYAYFYVNANIRGGRISFHTTDAADTLLAHKVHVIITSPPFPNRYDYLRMYGPELYFLSHTSAYVHQSLQTAILGTNVIKDYADYNSDIVFLEEHAPSTARFLRDIREKQRNGENDYYYRYFTRYYRRLFSIIDNLLASLEEDGSLYLVLQNNVHRGEINDIIYFVAEYCEAQGAMVYEAFRKLRSHQGRRNISAEHPLVVKKHAEHILKVIR